MKRTFKKTMKISISLTLTPCVTSCFWLVESNSYNVHESTITQCRISFSLVIFDARFVFVLFVAIENVIVILSSHFSSSIEILNRLKSKCFVWVYYAKKRKKKRQKRILSNEFNIQTKQQVTMCKHQPSKIVGVDR